MAAPYGMRELYGGAMTVDLPVDLIDSSDLRQIPDHQEVFLSPTTLTSIIFEINAYVTTQDIAVDNTNPNANLIPSLPADLTAATHHFTDVIATPDTLAAPLPLPRLVVLGKPSLASFPAYVLPGTIVSYEPSRRGNHSNNDGYSSSGSTQHPASQNPGPTSQQSSLVHQLQLLVRLQRYETDLCVRINVPTKEMSTTSSTSTGAGAGAGVSGGSEGDGNDDSAVRQEERFAAELLQRVVESLDVTDFGLFGDA